MVIWWNATWVSLLMRYLDTKPSTRGFSKLVLSATVLAAVEG